jgi:hypothetical protein
LLLTSKATTLTQRAQTNGKKGRRENQHKGGAGGALCGSQRDTFRISLCTLRFLALLRRAVALDVKGNGVDAKGAKKIDL